MMADELPTLDDLLTPAEQQGVIDQEIIPELQKREVKVTSWDPADVLYACVFILSRLYVLLRKAIAAIAAAGFEDFVFGFVAAPFGIDVTGWCELVAKNRYGVNRIQATYTRRLITLTNSTATPYPNISAGGIRLQFSSGNRYILESDKDGNVLYIPANGSIQAIFRSEFASDTARGIFYNGDITDDDIILITASFPGVEATNSATTYSEVRQSGSGVGLVTPSGSPAAHHSVAIRIESAGLAAGIAWSTALDGGSWTPQSGASISDLGGTGIDITLSNNGGNPAFAVGAFYYFSTPGTDVIALGRDQETPQELGARCRALWPLLAAVQDGLGNWIPGSPTLSAYELLARTASTQVKVAFAETGDINNEVKIVVAGQGALLPAGALVAVQGYLDHFSFLTDLPVVSSPTLRAIVLGGLTIVCYRGQRAVAQKAVLRALTLYLGGVDAARVLPINGKIEHGYLVSILEQCAGVKGISDTTMTINGAVADLQLPVTSGQREMAQWSQAPSTDFSWAEE
jgi:hypothetical protein